MIPTERSPLWRKRHESNKFGDLTTRQKHGRMKMKMKEYVESLKRLTAKRTDLTPWYILADSRIPKHIQTNERRNDMKNSKRNPEDTDVEEKGKDIGVEEDTEEQKQALDKAWKEGSEKARVSPTGNTITCPSCGIPNPTSRATCEICHERLRTQTTTKKGGVMDEMARELYAMNKKLKQAMTAGDKKAIAKITGQIKAAVAKSGGVFKVAESGLATQAKSTSPKPQREKKPKVTRKCPCCGKDVGGFFAMGHDGRVHGMLLKIKLEKMKLSEAPKGVQAMYEIFKKNSTLSMKEIAQRLEK